MICPKCQSEDIKVTDSRTAEDGSAIRRRRLCNDCGFRFSTIERIEGLEPMVIKKDGTRQLFSRDKLLSGLTVACSKRPVSNGQMLSICKLVETKILKEKNQEMRSDMIGEIVMGKLREIDKVAYVRFASVYKDFTNPETFADWVEGMAAENVK